MIDEPLIAIEVRAEDARRLGEQLAINIRGVTRLPHLPSAPVGFADWPDYLAWAKRLLAAIDRTKGQPSFVAQLQRACETALAYLTNVNTFDFEEVITALCNALRAAGTDADLLDVRRGVSRASHVRCTVLRGRQGASRQGGRAVPGRIRSRCTRRRAKRAGAWRAARSVGQASAPRWKRRARLMFFDATGF
jgi:hypothetical protein